MHRIDDLRYSMLPIVIVVGGLAGLILLQPDFGTAMSLVLIVGAMVFAAGLELPLSGRRGCWRLPRSSTSCS